MITINAYKFAENEKEATDSLFHENGTASGYAKRYKRKIMFYDIQKNPVGVLNTQGVIGSARKLDNGKIWYSYGDPFFTVGLTYEQKHAIKYDLMVRKDTTGFVFKK